MLAISATYDCGADVKAEILQMFAVAMLERGVNIWKNHQPVPQQDAENYQGLYLTGGRSLRVLIEGARVDILAEDMRGGSKKLYTNLLYQDGEIVWKPDYRFFFYQYEDKRYLMAKVQNRSFPLAVKAEDCPLPAAAGSLEGTHRQAVPDRQRLCRRHHRQQRAQRLPPADQQRGARDC